MIYPRLNEDETIVYQPSGEQLNKIVGKKDREKFVYRPGTNKLKRVGPYRRETPITWKLIKGLNKRSRLRKLVLDFVIERLKNRDNIVLKLNDVQNILSKGDIKELPEIQNVTFGDFWDKRMNDYKENPSIAPKVQSSSKKKEKDTEFEKDIIISEEVFNYFKENNKSQELEDFKNSVPSGKVIGPINQLFEFIHELITSEENVKIKTPRIQNLKREELNVDDKNKMKRDILQYISAYDNVKKFASDTKTYKNELINTDRKTFLKLLYKIEAQGVGRGETLLAYCVKNARFAGGSEPFDIEENGKTYEVKDYSNIGESRKTIENIRLGTHGKLTRFDFWGIIEDTISLAEDIYKKFDNEKFREILGDYFYEVWKNVISEDSNNKFAVKPGIDSGEINSGRLLTLKLWYNLAHELTLNDFTTDDKEKYTLAILKGSGVQSKSIAIEPLDPNDVSDVENINVTSEGDLNSIMRKLKSLTYVKQPDKFHKDLDNVANKYFEENKEIDYFLIFRPEEINIAGPDDFVFSTITQASVKIIEKKYVKQDDKVLNAFKKFKEEVEKAKQEADTSQEDALRNAIKNISYEDFITQEVIEESNKNFYPQIL